MLNSYAQLKTSVFSFILIVNIFINRFNFVLLLCIKLAITIGINMLKSFFSVSTIARQILLQADIAVLIAVKMPYAKTGVTHALAFGAVRSIRGTMLGCLTQR